MKKKSTVEEIRNRFDNDVERFSNLHTAQESTVDAPYVLNLIATAAGKIKPDANSLLDIGCGAGNYSLKIIELIPGIDITLIDLSKPMLNRAKSRLEKISKSRVTPLHGDIREIELPHESFDIIVAAAVLHHLRSKNEWESVFKKIQQSLKPGGIFLVSDLINHDIHDINSVMNNLYGDYLNSVKDESYKDAVFTCIEEEDSPRSLQFQNEVLLSAGFSHFDILHKNLCFAAFIAVK